MKRAILLAALMGSTGLLTSGCRPSGFGRHGTGVGERHQAVLAHIAKRLDLSETQRDQIGTILHARREAIHEAVSPALVAHARLARQVMDDPSAEEAIRAAGREAGRHVEDVAVAVAEVLAEVRAVLTPEQQAGLKEMREEFLRRHAKRLGTMQEVVDALQEATH